MRRIVTQNIGISIISKLIAFFLTILIARKFSTSEYAIYLNIALILSYAPYFQLGTMNGFSITYSNIKNRLGLDEANNFFCSYNLLTLFLIVPYVVFIVFFNNLQLSTEILILLLLTIFFQKIIENITSLFYINMDFEQANKTRFINEILPLALSVGAFYYSSTKEAIYIATFVGIFFAYIIVKKLYRERLFNLNLVSIKHFRELFIYGFPVYLIWLMDFGFRSLDRIFISKYYSDDIFASYGFASNLSMIQWMLTLNFMGPYVQVLINKISESKWIEVESYMKEVQKKIIIFICILTIVSLIGYPVLTIFIVKKFYSSYTLFALLLGASFFITINSLNIYYLTSVKESKLIIKYQVLITFLNLTIDTIVSKNHLDIKWMIGSSIANFILYYILLGRAVSSSIESKKREAELCI